MNPTLVFDIETIPDIAGLRVLHGLDARVSDAEVAEMAFQQRRQKTGSDFIQHHLQRVVAISCVLREGKNFKVWSLGSLDEDEGGIIQRFFDGIDKYTPQIVSWNGSGFDKRGAVPALLGYGRGRQGIQMEQLHQPLSHAPSGLDGSAGDVRRARQRAAG
jgi:predicted PolB exonuclease-like 3'-5' exonuclease